MVCSVSSTVHLRFELGLIREPVIQHLPRLFERLAEVEHLLKLRAGVGQRRRINVLEEDEDLRGLRFPSSLIPVANCVRYIGCVTQRNQHFKARLMKTKHDFQIIIEQDEAGFFVAECPALKACYAQGETYEEVMVNIIDVIELCLEDFKATGKPVPRQAEIIGVRHVEVMV